LLLQKLPKTIRKSSCDCQVRRLTELFCCFADFGRAGDMQWTDSPALGRRKPAAARKGGESDDEGFDDDGIRVWQAPSAIDEAALKVNMFRIGLIWISHPPPPQRPRRSDSCRILICWNVVAEARFVC
jgi:hypothetical protein